MIFTHLDLVNAAAALGIVLILFVCTERRKLDYQLEKRKITRSVYHAKTWRLGKIVYSLGFILAITVIFVYQFIAKT